MIESDLEDGTSTAGIVRQFSRQTGGHTAEKGSTKPGMLKHMDGSLLKPVVSPPRGPRELAFYEEVFNPKILDETVLNLQRFLPAFRGVFRMDDDKDRDYLKLEDITERFAYPCIMDVKMGSRTYDHEASESKIKRECDKYKGTKHKCGFSIPGIKVFDIKSKMYVTRCKDYGKSLTEKTVKDALKLFLNAEAGMDTRVLRELLQKLRKVLDWFNSQAKYEFYASSLLLVYDAKHALQQGTKDGASQPVESPCDRIQVPTTPTSDLTDVRMIDFAHVFPASKTDDNYIHGLKNLIEIFQDLLHEAQKVENG